MKRLIEKGLMFGNLVEVSSPALVERYRRAMKAASGRETALTDFHIDLSGFSPEVGDELGDMGYLAPGGVNRQFILLTTAQKTAPLLNSPLSPLRGVLEDFIAQNESQLFALTARDAVLGSLQSGVYDLTSPRALTEMRQITVEADTLGGHVAAAGQLTRLIERFRSEPAGWRDEALIGQMIELARKTGDVTRVPIALPPRATPLGSFWTSLFGGLYLFRDVRFPALICHDLPPGPVSVSPIYTLAQRNEIAEFLSRNGLTEPIVTARGMDAGAVLRQKMDFILVDAADRLGLDVGDGRRTELRKLAYSLGDALPAEFQGLAALLRWVEDKADWPRITSEHPAYFYSFRAAPGPHRDLVNMLLAELAPMDVRQMFILHKELFYAHYATWSERKRQYVADFLEREYKVDAQGVRAQLFGPEPGMNHGAAQPARDLGAVVGPWGAVDRSRR